MDFPSAIHIKCPSCGKETLHKVLKGRVGEHKQLTLECTIKCTECNFIHQTTITEKKLINVPLIVSTNDESACNTVELHPDEELRVGQELIVDENNVEITSLEVGNARRGHATAKEISTIWAKRTEIDGKVQVKISVHKGPNTLSHTITAVPDEEFFIGDILKIGRDNVAIYKMKTHTKVVKYDSAAARDIVRIYGRVIR
jgi:uncharacterized Zn finger protein